MKRLRDTATVSAKSVLASRVAPGIPPLWCRAASAAGASSIDTFLVYLGRSISSALQAVAESAETSRSQLFETRAALHAAIDLRCDELATTIESSEASKAASLERELVAVDAALERWQAESGSVCEAVSSLSQTDLELQLTALSSRLDDMESQLHALPTDVVEPPIVGLLVDAATLLSSIAGFGHVLAPLSITSGDLTAEGVPTRVRPGTSQDLRLSLGARHASQSAEELEFSLGRLARVSRVEVALDNPNGDYQSLQVTLAPDTVRRGLRVTFTVPLSACESSLRIGSIDVAGQAIPGLPAHYPVLLGVKAPLTLKCAFLHKLTTPCISHDGWLYSPIGSGPEVLVFGADGAPLPGLPVASLGLSSDTGWSAYAESDAPTILLADDVVPSVLVAVDPVSSNVRWKSSETRPCEYGGIVALPKLGVAIVIGMGSYRRLFAKRLSDGRSLGGFDLGQLGYGVFLAADLAAEVVFASLVVDDACCVHAFSCVSDGASIKITMIGPVTAARGRTCLRPLAVVPSAPGKKASHLVVCDGDELLVLSLPSLALLHTHTLIDMEVTGLAADPWGGALAVCDECTQAIHILAWPLPGMPPLQ